jgi:hypothetical protein
MENPEANLVEEQEQEKGAGGRKEMVLQPGAPEEEPKHKVIREQYNQTVKKDDSPEGKGLLAEIPIYDLANLIHFLPPPIYEGWIYCKVSEFFQNLKIITIFTQLK